MSLGAARPSRVHPWRRPAPPATLDAAAIHRVIAEEAAFRTLGEHSGSNPLVAAVAARYSPGASPEGPLDLETEATAAMMFGEQASSTTEVGATSLLVDVWVATEGPTFALEALLRYEGPPTDPYSQQHPCSTRYFSSGILGPWARLRERLTQVSERAYERARLAAEARRADLDRGRRCAVAYLFPLEPGWAKQEIEAYAYALEAAEPQWGRTHGALGPLASSVDDLATLRALLENAPTAWSYVLRDGHVFTALDRLGDGVFDVLPMLDPDANEWGCLTREAARRALLDVYAGVSGMAAARGVVDFLSDAPLARATRAVLTRDPESGIVALAELIGRHPRRKKTHGPALAELASAYPEAASVALEKLDDAARAALAPWLVEQDLLARKGTKRRAGATIPTPNAWLDVASLPRPEQLSVEELRAIVGALARTRPGEHLERAVAVPPGAVTAPLEPLAWALVDAWAAAGGPSSDAWVVRSLATLGDPGAAKRVATRVRDWVSAGALRVALLGVQALAHLDDPTVIVELDKLTSLGPEIRAAAEAALTRVLRAQGLTEEDLFDRLVPSCGLTAGAGGAPGSAVTLDFGTTTLEVRFDDEMAPHLVDASGRVATVPRPARGENAKTSAEARERWNEIKQTLAATVATETKRLERAMCSRRRWISRSFREVVVPHPVLANIARRLVWTDHGTAPTTLFRIAEDGSFADVHDEPVRLTGPVGLLHPLETTPSESVMWSGVLADYALLQPFPQLGREVHRLPPGHERATTVPGWKQVGANEKAAFMLESRGWEVTVTHDGELLADRVLDEVSGATIEFGRGAGGLAVHRVTTTEMLGAIHEVSTSELLRDLEWIRR